VSGITNAIFGSGESTTNVTTAPASPEELELIKLNTALAQRQLQNLDALAPFQKELIELSLADMRRQGAESSAFDAAVSPDEQAAFAREEFDRARKLGPIQDQLLQAQLDAMQGKISPEQQQAMEAAIQAGSGDIDRATSEGIGLISDELANSRGLRLTDTPILREATMLAESGMEQKKSLSQNIRAQGMFQFPQLSSGIAMGQQNLAEATKAFQADLRQRAFQNRMALTGQASQSGIGLTSIGSGVGASQASTLAGTRGRTQTGFDPASIITSYGNLARGIGMAAAGK